MVKLFTPISYRLDSKDFITFVNEDWNSFALENGAPELTGTQVLQKIIWDFIAGSEIRALYRLIFQRVRSANIRPEILYRCDAPELKRFMKMDIFLCETGEIQCDHFLLKESVRERFFEIELSPQEKSSRLLIMCSVCKKVRITEEHWEEIEWVIKDSELFLQSKIPKISHGLCNTCFLELKKKYNLS